MDQSNCGVLWTYVVMFIIRPVNRCLSDKWRFNVASNTSRHLPVLLPSSRITNIFLDFFKRSDLFAIQADKGLPFSFDKIFASSLSVIEEPWCPLQKTTVRSWLIVHIFCNAIKQLMAPQKMGRGLFGDQTHGVWENLFSLGGIKGLPFQQ